MFCPVLNFMKYKKLIIGFITAAVFLIAVSSLLLSKEKVLVITDVEKDKKFEFIIPERKFVLSYIHSVQHTPAFEYMKINDDNTIELVETRFYSLGIGLPSSDENGAFENEDGEFVLKFNRIYEEINLRISPIPEHSIEINGVDYSLLDFADPEDRVNLKVVDKWVIQGMK